MFQAPRGRLTFLTDHVDQEIQMIKVSVFGFFLTVTVFLFYYKIIDILPPYSLASVASTLFYLMSIVATSPSSRGLRLFNNL
jgi:hypothetical protein